MKLKLKPKLISAALLLMTATASPFLVNAKTFTSLELLTKENKPASILHENKLKNLSTITTPELDKVFLLKEDQQREIDNLPYRFAKEVKNIDKKGQWEIQGDTAIWRFTVSSETAESFSLGLKNVFLPQQAKLYFYTSNYQNLVGPYTHKDNKKHKQLWSPVMESNDVTVEINVPVKYKSLLSFDLATISQGYRGIKSDDLAKSGSCNNDVVCSEADAWRDEIRSVARYTINVGGSSFLCTGTLMNNTNGNWKPYFLTAGHCGVDISTSPSIVLYWNYETSACQGTPNGQLNQFQTGTSYLAGTSPSGVVGSDYAIVELDVMPDFNVFWSGWDRSPVAPSSAVSIHHPAGDEKRISFDTDSLTLTTYTNDAIDANGTHMRVGEWEDGTTEGGSSGSGLWNSEHRLVGTLSGGAASCTAQDAPDWYGRLSTHWEGGDSGTGKAKDWLDTATTGQMSINGLDTCDFPTVTISATPANASIGDVLNLSVQATGGTGSYSYSWDFNQDKVSDRTGASVSFSYKSLFQGNIVVTATDSSGCPGKDNAAIVIGNAGNELFPENNALPSGWVMSSGANASWSVDNATAAAEGASSIKSATISDDQTASIEVTHTFDDPNEKFIAFAYKVSSEAQFDKLVFSVDGVDKLSASGDVDWTTYFLALTSGSHLLKWSYVKDASVSEGSDNAWIDGVTGLGVVTSTNNPPIANVTNVTQTVDEETSVTLNASTSSDPDGDPLTFLWSKVSGVDVNLLNANTAVATFNAPTVTSSTELVFQVTVMDSNGGSDSETVIVTVNAINEAPIASVVNSTQSVNEGTIVTLDASNSSDPDADTLTYSWSQTAAESPSVTLTNAATAVASFNAPDVSSDTQLTFTVTVTDPSGEFSTANINVTVKNVVAVTPPSTSDSSGGGSFGFSILGLLFLTGFSTRKKKL